MPQNRRFFNKAISAQVADCVCQLRDALDHVIDVALRIDPPRNRKTHQLFGRRDFLAGLWILPSEHERADFDTADADLAEQRDAQRQARKLRRRNWGKLRPASI